MGIPENQKYPTDKNSITVEDVTLVNDDSYHWVPNNSIDFVLTDPPFNIARDTNFHTYEGNTINSFRFDADKGWDSYSAEDFRTLLALWSVEFNRVLRPGGSFAVFCADEYLSDLIVSLRAAGLKPRRTITWRKPNAVPVNRKHMMMSACEYIVVGVKGSKSVFNADIDIQPNGKFTFQEIIAIADKAATVTEQEIRKALSAMDTRPTAEIIATKVSEALKRASKVISERSINIYSDSGETADLCVPNFVTFNSKAGNRLHPTEKPVELLRYLTELFSNPGETILDPFAGSASTGETALLTNRKAILIEQDQEFFEKGKNRLEKILAKKQAILFDQ